jgi:hypothetical protein
MSNLDSHSFRRATEPDPVVLILKDLRRSLDLTVALPKLVLAVESEWARYYNLRKAVERIIQRPFSTEELMLLDKLNDPT